MKIIKRFVTLDEQYLLLWEIHNLEIGISKCNPTVMCTFHSNNSRLKLTVVVLLLLFHSNSTDTLLYHYVITLLSENLILQLLAFL